MVADAPILKDEYVYFGIIKLTSSS
jgi:hypothetical protein